MKQTYPRITVGVDFVLLLCVLYVLDSNQILAPALAAALLHEAAHLLVAIWVGGRIKKIHLSAFGACITLSNIPMLSYPREAAIAAAGPVAGLLAAYVSARLGFFVFSGMNFALALCNLLPVPPLDGGRILHALLAIFFSPEFAERVVYFLGILVALLLLLFCAYLTWQGVCTIPVLLFCGFLVGSLIKKSAPC